MKIRLTLILIAFGLTAMACNLPVVGSLVSTATQTPWPIPNPPDPSLLGTIKYDLTYCTMDGVDLKLDAYFPEEAEIAMPVVVYIHGGGWTAGDKSSSLAVNIKQMLDQGYLIVSINYRLLPEYPFPASIEDVMCAVRHLKVEAEKYGLDPNRIAAMGASAGGHLAAMVGLAGPEDGLGLSGPYQGVSSEVQAVIMLAGPSDLSDWVEGDTSTLPIEAPLGQNPLAWINPTTYVQPGAPPFLLLHGNKDIVVPVSQSEDFYQLLKANGIEVQLQVVANAGHAFMPAGGQMKPSRPAISTLVVRFLNETIK